MFLETVEIAQGRKSLSPRYEALASHFSRRFNIRVLNAAIDRFRVNDNSERLTVWVATDADREACDDATGNCDKVKQRTAASLVQPTPSFLRFVSYEDQALIALVSFLQARAEDARMCINDSRILRIDSFYKRTVVFVHTDLERDALINSPEKLVWEGLLWEWLTAQQPPETVSREKFRIEIDSQENYKVHYQGNGYWYWR
jgi:hypothetical protein